MAAPMNQAKPHSRAHRRPVSSGPLRALVELPASGCDLPIPSPPAGRDWTPAELDRWRELWESPQANAWDDTARGIVAVLVCYESEVFSGTAAAWQAAELRHASEALGLTPRALAQLGWRITEASR